MNIPIEDEELIEISKAARILGVAMETLRRWERAGKIRSVRFNLNQRNSRRRYRKSDIEALVNQGKDDSSLKT